MFSPNVYCDGEKGVRTLHSWFQKQRSDSGCEHPSLSHIDAFYWCTVQSECLDDECAFLKVRFYQNGLSEA